MDRSLPDQQAMPNEAEIYADYMTGVRMRIDEIRRILGVTNMPDFARNELIFLQFRKALELIAFASLAANKNVVAARLMTIYWRSDDQSVDSTFGEEYVRRMPISEQAKQDLLRLEDPNQPDYMPGLSSEQKKDRLARISYRDYLLNVAKVDEQAYWFYMATGRGVFCVGGDALPALFSMVMLA
jgi:hypothetical protein